MLERGREELDGFKAVGLETKMLPCTAPTFCAQCVAKSVVKCEREAKGQKH